MSNPVTATTTAALDPPARTHQQAIELFRRPFAPGAIGFRAMTKVALNGQPYAGAQVAAFLNAQSVVQRLNSVVPGRWRQAFTPVPAELIPAPRGDGQANKKLYLACRLIVRLPVEDGGAEVDAVYEDIGEMDAGSLAGLKALYSDARKRAGVAAGIGAYLYTALAPVVLAIGPGSRQVQAIRRQGKSDLLVLSAETERWLRNGYRLRMETSSVQRDLGPILPHGEPDDSMGQGETTDEAAQPVGDQTATDAGQPRGADAPAHGNGAADVVSVDFGGLGPATPGAA
jgi:hypothetical protein